MRVGGRIGVGVQGTAITALLTNLARVDGTRVQVVGVAQDGKYGKLTEDPHAAMFLPILRERMLRIL
jgi:hypothetical protein